MKLIIDPRWEKLGGGTPEERACSAFIEIFAGDVSLTRAEDGFVEQVRSGAHLSAYHLAEWFAWNWWRQRWEPRTKAPDWEMAHHMSTVGQGYVWPNITIVSDGERIGLGAKPTKRRKQEPIHYLVDFQAAFPAIEFERAVSGFVEKVRSQLRHEGIAETNLDQIWADVCAERDDPEVAKRRKLEALLGQDPDEAEEKRLDQLVAQEGILGENAVHELVASSSALHKVLMSEDIAEIANTAGYDSCPKDSVRLKIQPPLEREIMPAWRRGASAAQILRKQEHLSRSPISNRKLAEMTGVDGTALEHREDGVGLSFLFDDSADAGRVVIGSKWETGRRFNLARLLGDRIVETGNGRLFPATQTYTYRQKLQRAFSAEFLSPFDAVLEMLDGDFSEEAQQDVAKHFNVSPFAINTSLVNNGQIDRVDLD